MSQTIGKLAEALSACQSEIPMVRRGAEASSEGMGGRATKYRYADLSMIWAAARKVLTGHGLSVSQTFGQAGDRLTIQTILMHTSGEWLAGEQAIVCESKDPRVLGGRISYMRRFGMACIIGAVAADEDDDMAVSADPAARGMQYTGRKAPQRPAAQPRPVQEPRQERQLYQKAPAPQEQPQARPQPQEPPAPQRAPEPDLPPAAPQAPPSAALIIERIKALRTAGGGELPAWVGNRIASCLTPEEQAAGAVIRGRNVELLIARDAPTAARLAEDLISAAARHAGKGA